LVKETTVFVGPIWALQSERVKNWFALVRTILVATHAGELAGLAILTSRWGINSEGQLRRRFHIDRINTLELDTVHSAGHKDLGFLPSPY